MFCRGVLIIAIALCAGVAAAQQEWCPECAAADVCVRLYGEGMTKHRADSQKRIREFVKGVREAALPKGDELIARGTETMESGAALEAKLKHVDGLKECLGRLR